jgi:hypothetical protein
MCGCSTCKRLSIAIGENTFFDWGSTPLESILLYNFDWASTTHQTRLGFSPPSYSNSHINYLLKYIMLGFHLAASWQHYKNKHYDGGSVIPCFESFQLSKDCDHNVDKLGAHMKPMFCPTWREFLYEEARGVILVALLYWSFTILQFFMLNFLGHALSHYLHIVVIEIPLQSHWYMNFFGKSHEP